MCVQVCRNLEWQVCAASGKLAGQRGATLIFAFPPGELEPHGHRRPPIGSCTGYHPRGCGTRGYASSDIYYLEVCIYSAICANREQLFAQPIGQPWKCELEWAGFRQLRDEILRGLT